MLRGVDTLTNLLQCCASLSHALQTQPVCVHVPVHILLVAYVSTSVHAWHINRQQERTTYCSQSRFIHRMHRSPLLFWIAAS